MNLHRPICQIVMFFIIAEVACWGKAEDEGAASSPTPVARAMLSHTQRFIAVGPRPDELIGVLIWVEEFADRLARFTGRALPVEHGAPLRIVLRDDVQQTSATIAFSQGEESGGWTQRVHVVNPGVADPQEVLDALAFLLLSRHPQSRQSAVERRNRPAVVPAWWSDGIARHVLPKLRAKARRDVQEASEKGRYLPFNRLLMARSMTPGDGVEKAYAAVAVAWLRARRDFDEIFAGLTQRWAAGITEDAAWLGDRIAPGSPWREVEIEWELWLASLRGRQGEFVPATVADVNSLREALTLRRGNAPEKWPPTLPDPMPLEYLIEHRNEAWVAEACRRLAGTADRLRYGRDADMRDVIDRFLLFLRAVERAGAHSSLPGGRWWERRRLERLLAEARGALARLELKVSLQEKEPPSVLNNRPSPFASQEGLERRAWLEIQHDAEQTASPLRTGIR